MNHRILVPFLSLCLLAPFSLWAAAGQDYREGGEALLRAGLYSKAIHYFQKAVQADPQDWQAYEDLGDASAKTDDLAGAREAYQKSLQLNPDNPKVRVLLENLGGSPNPPVNQFDSEDNVNSAPVRPNPAPPRPQPVSFNDGQAPMNHSRFWLKFDLGYNDSRQGDLLNSASVQNTLVRDNGWTGSAVASHSGFGLGFEGGFQINAYNGLAIGLRDIHNDDYRQNISLRNGPATVLGNTYNSDFENLTLSCYVVPITLDYYLFLPDSTGRFFLSAGLGYYAGVVQVSDDYSYVISSGDPTFYDTFSGDLRAGGVGFQVGIGREWQLARDWGLSVFARGRYAKLSHFQGTVYAPGGGEATEGLAVLSDGEIYPYPLENIGNNGVGYATIDFTGFDVGAAISLFAF